ncbi:MAG TPA: radical SAM/SPASM domain-containing protein [Elusimicrobiota bacterium]|nr:radical SAM/SPASM domain-containing protein [Elusimicrobiota bacterium]
MTAPPRKRFEKIYVEISNVCNLKCDFCPEVARDKDVMDAGLFARIVADAAPLAEQVCLHLMGEPLTHPRFAELIDICAARSLPVNLTTNGTLLSAERTDALLSPIVRQVNFSLHSFEANFPGQDIGSYIEKIFAFTRKAFEKRPDLYVNYRLWNLDGSEASKNDALISRIEKAFGVELEKQIDVRWRKGRHVVNRLYLHFDSRFEWPNPAAPLLSETGTCRALSSHLGVLTDGTVVPCCLDKEGVTVLGDARRQTLSEALAGERAAAMARGFAQGRLVEDLCRRCAFIARFDGKARRLAAAAR